MNEFQPLDILLELVVLGSTSTSSGDSSPKAST